jgi:hypothetical protein
VRFLSDKEAKERMNNNGERKKRLREKRDKNGLYVLSGYSWYFFNSCTK